MKGSVSSFTETILKNCFLAGDEKIKSEDHYINGLQNDIDEIATIPDHQIIREAGFVYIVVKDTKIRFREANRGDVKAAEKRNPGFRPFLSEEEILKRCAEDKTQIEDLKKSNPPVYLGFLTAADELKKKIVRYYSEALKGGGNYDDLSVFEKIDISLQYYLGIDPDTLSDEEYITKFRALQWIRQEESKER